MLCKSASIWKSIYITPLYSMIIQHISIESLKCDKASLYDFSFNKKACFLRVSLFSQYLQYGFSFNKKACFLNRETGFSRVKDKLRISTVSSAAPLSFDSNQDRWLCAPIVTQGLPFRKRSTSINFQRTMFL